MEIPFMPIQYALKKFKESTKQYFGKEVELDRVNGTDIYLKGKIVKVSFKTLLGASIFYNWRVANNISCDSPITEKDVHFLEILLESKTISLPTIAYVLGVSPSSMCVNHKTSGDIWKSYRTVVNNKNKQVARFEWKGISGTADDWAIELKITKQTFRNRIAKHGLCYLVFLGREEYKNIPNEEKDKYVNPNGIKEKRTYDTYERNRACKGEKIMTIDTESSILIIQRLIEDSKENIEKGPTKKNKYYESSYKFLLNSNKLLEYYLDSVGILETKECLKQLMYFAEITHNKHLGAI